MRGKLLLEVVATSEPWLTPFQEIATFSALLVVMLRFIGDGG
jgi:hypothetical protein